MRNFYLFLISISLLACDTTKETASSTDSKISVESTAAETSSTDPSMPPTAEPTAPNNSGAAPSGQGANFKLAVGRFDSAIAAFEAEDAKNGYTKDGILFTGSSSIRFWTSMQEDMQGLPVLNRGFGGSTIPEVLHYQDRYLFQHRPQIVVFYCGENDIHAGASPEMVLESFEEFTRILEQRLPDTKLVFISMKPSLARWDMWDKFQEGNALIKDFIDSKPNMTYLDCSLSMLKADGNVKEDIFVEDGLHMNAKGYEGWTKQLYPILKEIYVKN